MKTAQPGLSHCYPAGLPSSDNPSTLSLQTGTHHELTFHRSRYARLDAPSRCLSARPRTRIRPRCGDHRARAVRVVDAVAAIPGLRRSFGTSRRRSSRRSSRRTRAALSLLCSCSAPFLTMSAAARCWRADWAGCSDRCSCSRSPGRSRGCSWLGRCRDSPPVRSSAPAARRGWISSRRERLESPGCTWRSPRRSPGGCSTPKAITAASVASISTGSPLLFLTATAVTGAGWGVAFLGALRSVSAAATASQSASRDDRGLLCRRLFRACLACRARRPRRAGSRQRDNLPDLRYRRHRPTVTTAAGTRRGIARIR
jgi:hypothetical protein